MKIPALYRSVDIPGSDAEITKALTFIALACVSADDGLKQHLDFITGHILAVKLLAKLSMKRGPKSFRNWSG